jgi:hypothetical protein
VEIRWSVALSLPLHVYLILPSGNFDLTQLHYEGAGEYPGSNGKPYGYSLRVAEQAATA